MVAIIDWPISLMKTNDMCVGRRFAYGFLRCFVDFAMVKMGSHPAYVTSSMLYYYLYIRVGRRRNVLILINHVPALLTRKL